MNKSLAIAVIALAFAAVNGQTTTTMVAATATTNSTGNGTSLAFCRATTDCATGYCCGSTQTSAVAYIQFNCVKASNGTTNTTGYACIPPGQAYTDVCASQTKTCISNSSKYTICGSSVATATIDLFNSNLQCSNAFGLVSSVLFAVIASLALVF